MKPNAFNIILTILTVFASLTTASVQIVKNYCDVSIYVTLVNGSGTVTVDAYEVPPQNAYLNEIVGEGNDCKVSLEPDINGPPVPVFVLGSSTRDAILYW